MVWLTSYETIKEFPSAVDGINRRHSANQENYKMNIVKFDTVTMDALDSKSRDSQLVFLWLTIIGFDLKETTAALRKARANVRTIKTELDAVDRSEQPLHSLRIRLGKAERKVTKLLEEIERTKSWEARYQDLNRQAVEAVQQEIEARQMVREASLAA
jgi:2-succinyl-5-enolpyruvyl-6-hydroxy-3-cyclohexene-1-carboxylate synthase